MSEKTVQLKAAVAKDMAPKSVDHWFRFVIGSLLVAAAVFISVTLVLKGQPFNKENIGVIALFAIGGLGVMFTGAVLALLKAVPLPPFLKRGNGTG